MQENQENYKGESHIIDVDRGGSLKKGERVKTRYLVNKPGDREEWMTAAQFMNKSGKTLNKALHIVKEAKQAYAEKQTKFHEMLKEIREDPDKFTVLYEDILHEYAKKHDIRNISSSDTKKKGQIVVKGKRNITLPFELQHDNTITLFLTDDVNTDDPEFLYARAWLCFKNIGKIKYLIIVTKAENESRTIDGNTKHCIEHCIRQLVATYRTQIPRLTPEKSPKTTPENSPEKYDKNSSRSQIYDTSLSDVSDEIIDQNGAQICIDGYASPEQ